MPVTLSGRKIFLASPSDLAPEREVTRKVIREFSETQALRQGASLIATGWESVPGGIGRPQGQINPLIAECDFMVLILGERWGSPPSTSDQFSSGTEEEFSEFCRLLAAPDAFMRDILILFKAVEPRLLTDPGEQLKKVLEFKAQLQESREIMYNTFDSIDSFTRHLERKLGQWSLPLDDRISKVLVLPASPPSPQTSGTSQDLLSTARALEAGGLVVQAEAVFAQAIEDRDPEARIAFASFLRRRGRLTQALNIDHQILSDADLLSATDQSSIQHRVNVLSNMGVIYRKQGALTQSRDSLREAVMTAKTSPSPIDVALSYALDNLGLTLLQIGDLDKAAAHFGESLELRKSLGQTAGIAQSFINLGRTAMAAADFDHAATEFNEALCVLLPNDSTTLRANALAGVAEARLRLAQLEGVGELVDETLEINEQLGNVDGGGIGYFLKAWLLLLQGSREESRAAAERCLEQSERSGSKTGMARVSWLNGEISIAQGDHARAQEDLKTAGLLSGEFENSLLANDIRVSMSKLNA